MGLGESWGTLRDVRDDRSSPTVAAREGREPLRFVVLIEPGTAAPAALLSSLAKRHATVSVCGEAAQVMVELAQQRARAVILVHDLADESIGQLMEAVAAHYAGTGLWHYTVNSDGQPALGQAVAPLLRQAAKSTDTKAPGPEPLVSEQELAMLLGPAQRWPSSSGGD